MFLVRMLSVVKVKKIKNKHGTGINTSVSELSLQGWRWKKKEEAISYLVLLILV